MSGSDRWISIRRSGRRPWFLWRVNVLRIALLGLPAAAAAQTGVSTGSAGDPALRGHGGPVRAIVALAPGRAATGGFDATIIAWDLDKGAAQRVIRVHETAVTALAAASASCVVSGSQDGGVVRWCVDAGTSAAEMSTRLGRHDAAVSALAVSPDGARLASGAWDRRVQLWSLGGTAAGASPDVIAEHKAPVTGVAFGVDGQTIFSVGYDGELRATSLDRPGGAPRREVGRLEMGVAINGLVALRDGRLALSCADGRLRIVGTGLGIEAAIELADSALTAVALSPDGRRLAVGGVRTQVALVDIASGKVERRILGPDFPIWALTFSTDGRELLTGGADGALRRWDAASGAALDVSPTAATHDGARMQSEQGARVFRACIACHTTRASEGHRAGPTLHGIFGRRIASAPGYRYSEPLQRLDIVWNAETIARLFEVGPSVFTPGTKMPEQRITDPADRRALVEWLERETRP